MQAWGHENAWEARRNRDADRYLTRRGSAHRACMYKHCGVCRSPVYEVEDLVHAATVPSSLLCFLPGGCLAQLVVPQKLRLFEEG